MATTERAFPCERCGQDMGFHGYLLAVDGVCGPCQRRSVRPEVRAEIMRQINKVQARAQLIRQAAEKASFQGRG